MPVAVVVVLVLLALIFGIGAIVKGVLWLLLLTAVLLVVAGYAGSRWVRNRV